MGLRGVTMILKTDVIQSEKGTTFGIVFNYDQGQPRVLTPPPLRELGEDPMMREKIHFPAALCGWCSPPTGLGRQPIRKQRSSGGFKTNSDGRARSFCNKCLNHSFMTAATTRFWLSLALTPCSVNVQLKTVS